MISRFKTLLLKILMSALILLLYHNLNAQSIVQGEKIRPWQLKSYAKSAERNGDVYSAIDYYEAYVERFPNNLKVARHMAGLYHKARDYENAGFNYLKTYHLNIDRYTKSLYYYALMEKMQGNYDRAIENFERFYKEYKKQKDTREYRKLANLQMEGCRLALELQEKKRKQVVVIKHLNSSINKAHIEFAPTYIDDVTMLYASLPVDEINYYPADDSSTWPVRQFYTAAKVGSNWQGGRPFEGPFNLDGINTGNGAYSPDGKRFYFNRCQLNWQNKMICHIYISKKVDGEWTEPVSAGDLINLDNYTSTQPTVGHSWKKNKEVVYFASDRPEGKGGMDIWYTVYDTIDNVFSEPRELSRKINTNADEITPYYDNEAKTLYFSTNGKVSIGGFDIYQADGEETKFIDAQNMGLPFNSPADDVYFVMNKNQQEGFFVSNRPGGTSLRSETCCDDIYSFYIPNYIRYTAKGILQEDTTNILREYIAEQEFSIKSSRNEFYPKRLNRVQISLYLIDKTTDETILVNQKRSNSRGEYEFNLMQNKNYKAVINEEGIFQKELTFNTFDEDNNEILLDTLSMIIMPDQPLVIKNIYYEFDRAELSEDAMNSIDSTLLRILEEIPKIIVEISSHTDNKGNDDYNLRLSQQRAESVVRYLVRMGIDNERLIAKGYGEERPLVSNTFPDGSDNPEGREKNRRTEFRVIGRVEDVEEGF